MANEGYIYCKPGRAQMLKTTCELRKRRGTVIECKGCPGGEPLKDHTPPTVPDPPVESEALCSKCGKKPCGSTLKSRKWSGGVGLCWGCYEIIRKEEPPAKRGGSVKKKTKPAPKAKPAPAPPPPVRKPETIESIPLGAFESLEKGQEICDFLEEHGLKYEVEVRIRILSDEGRAH